jgi:hypothetical protein
VVTLAASLKVGSNTSANKYLGLQIPEGRLINVLTFIRNIVVEMFKLVQEI